MTISILPIGNEHWAELPHIHRAAILAVSNSFYDQEARESWAHGLTTEGYKHSADDGEIFHVAVDDHGKVVGFCGYRGYEITALFVAPEFQNRGIATALFNKAVVEILNGRPEKIILTTSYPALPFFKQQGLETIGEREEITRGGDFIRVFDMQASLKKPPHEGRELELMLAEKKKVAYFSKNAPEDVFRPHILSGRIKRFEWTEQAENLDRQLKERGIIDSSATAPIIFYLANCEAEKDRFIDLLTKHQIRGEYNNRDELEMGMLLGYPPFAVKAFMERMRAMRKNSSE